MISENCLLLITFIKASPDEKAQNLIPAKFQSIAENKLLLKITEEKKRRKRITRKTKRQGILRTKGITG